MKTIYFIRHAQSEANLKDILASRQDFPLTEKGRQQGRHLSRIEQYEIRNTNLRLSNG